jgi:hypothetical protein
VSPLARAQNAEEISRTLNFMGALVQFMGPEASGSYINTEEAVPYVAELYEIPAKLLLDNSGRVQQAKNSQELAQLMQNAVTPTPTEEYRQRIEKGPLQPQ